MDTQENFNFSENKGLHILNKIKTVSGFLKVFKQTSGNLGYFGCFNNQNILNCILETSSYLIRRYVRCNCFSINILITFINYV